MELTLESAFSTGGLVGHASYLLLVLSMMMRGMTLLRILVILSAFMSILYDTVWLKDPVGVFWESMLVLVNIVQLAITWQQNRSARFSDEEKVFMEGHLPDLSMSQRRKLLNQGIWITGEEETDLTTEGKPVDHLVYLATGQALVYSGKHPVAVCDPGSFIGEMTVMNGEPANGTVRLKTTSRYWAIEAGRLRELLKKEPEIKNALEGGFSRNMRDKLVRSNKFILDSGGVRKPSPPNKPSAA
ncbi:Crp/Fnr family transcriptional regulator [Oricola sp.]|mgnify:CR=1 FL=1|uniref:Crp/Fnr family transcriptional regulator n=1 Tax=Oricola sp. TaxID=1979950 RepID=UPI000C8D3652|nr:cyclic nucleotide-binding protein [Ahrensia sp.]|tara:strand:+ start:8214 stop:8942 length:729 start_codon:yes stop_codon:yes gene_type:complete